MSKRQSYQNHNRGFMKTLLLSMIAMSGSLWNDVFNRGKRNTGKAGGHLDTSYHSGGGSGGHHNTPIAPHKAKAERKRVRKEVQKSQRINRKRKAKICSFK